MYKPYNKNENKNKSYIRTLQDRGCLTSSVSARRRTSPTTWLSENRGQNTQYTNVSCTRSIRINWIQTIFEITKNGRKRISKFFYRTTTRAVRLSRTNYRNSSAEDTRVIPWYCLVAVHLEEIIIVRTIAIAHVFSGKPDRSGMPDGGVGGKGIRTNLNSTRDLDQNHRGACRRDGITNRRSYFDFRIIAESTLSLITEFWTYANVLIYGIA